MEAPAEKTQQHQVACFSCRASRQKCDRQEPCKPDSVEKLLARIEESGAREEVLTALLGQSLPSPNTTVSIRSTPHGHGSDPAHDHGHDTSQSSRSVTQRRSVTYDDSEDEEGLVSPITLVTNAISMNTSLACERLRSQMPMQPGMREAIMAPIKERLATYFASHRAQQKDWEVLATQAVDSAFKLERGTCDPLASRLIDDNDASLYFQLFFQIRHPLIGLLDATLHTREYVYGCSFTLFSVICALGCAVSARPRDRAIYPVLSSLASGNIKWCIAASVKSLSTVQAIITFQYWAPLAPRQAEDPYWLSLSHAIQLAKEMGINRPDIVKEYVDAEFPNATLDSKERYIRNYERTWLYTFIADKGFGALNGRLQCISWRTVPRNAAEWWKSPVAEPSDRIISGVIEIRGLLLQAMEKRRHIVSSPSQILEWHKEAYDHLNRIRNERCQPDNLPSSRCLPILAFYMDHSILVFNAQALRDLAISKDPSAPAALLTIQRKSIEVAGRIFDHLLADKTMNDVSVGFQNNQFLMICHAMSEILRAVKKGGMTAEEVSAAANKVISVIPFFDRVVQQLPATSAAHLHFDLARFFACQIDSLVAAPDPQAMKDSIDQGMFTDDWFKSIDAGVPDASTFIDMGYLGVDQSMMDTSGFFDFNDLNGMA
ncbi:fungal transcriptional regulatory [Fusarium beomiforme]|uniref:Fungal transcriptional regulatory n=1 Tax=Fusarium beomiforme TaxID=44412 RepID=A0A9P5AQD9_9HYPO|nr:fungal transcriptional regulatory [Fusarium beomiforme]